MSEPVIVELEEGPYLVVAGLTAEAAGAIAVEAAGAPAIEGLRVASVEEGVWMVEDNDEAPAGMRGDPYWVVCEEHERGAVPAFRVRLDFGRATT